MNTIVLQSKRSARSTQSRVLSSSKVGFDLRCMHNVGRRTQDSFGGTRVLSQQGFTLIELIVVIAIMAIMASIAAPSMSNAMNNYQHKKAVDDIGNQIKSLRTQAVDKNTLVEFDLPLGVHGDVTVAKLGAAPSKIAFNKSNGVVNPASSNSPILGDIRYRITHSGTNAEYILVVQASGSSLVYKQ